MFRAAWIAAAAATISVAAAAAPAAAWVPHQDPADGARSGTATTASPTAGSADTAAPAGAPAVPGIVADTTPPPAKGEGIYSAPEWLPLRHDLDGGEIKVGCTHDSHGSQFAYECGGHHRYWALDLLATRGTPVYAAGSGFARNATGQSGSSGYGNVVRIDHGFGVESLYAHLDQVLLPAEGAWVDPDTVIGVVGNTGSSSAPHLHFEKRVDGAAGQDSSVDPGPLKACVLANVVAYPQIRGIETWDHLPWGALSVFSDGTSCDSEAVAAAEADAPTTTSAPATPATTSSSVGDDLAGRLPTSWLVLALSGLGQTG